MIADPMLLKAAKDLLAARKALMTLLADPATCRALPGSIDMAQDEVQASVVALEQAVKMAEVHWCPICTARNWTQIGSRHVQHGDNWWCPTHLAYVKSERG